MAGRATGHHSSPLSPALRFTAGESKTLRRRRTACKWGLLLLLQTSSSRECCHLCGGLARILTRQTCPCVLRRPTPLTALGLVGAIPDGMSGWTESYRTCAFPWEGLGRISVSTKTCLHRKNQLVPNIFTGFLK
jgi:hypothetical protein